MMDSRRVATSTWGAFLLYLTATIVMTYPFSLHPATGVLAIGTDTDLPIWTLAWDVHAFVHQPFAIFDANIFFPFKHTLAYSENLIGSALLAAPVIWLTDNPMLAMNLVVLASVVFCGQGGYVLGRRIGLSGPAAFIAGLVYAFSPPRLLRLDQFHLATMAWIPFSLAYLHTYFAGGRARDLRIAIAFFSFQALTSGHGGALLTLGVILFLAYARLTGHPVAWRQRLRDCGWQGVALVLPAALVYLPYRAAQVEIGFRRILDDVGVPLSSYFTSPAYVQQWLLARAPAWQWLATPPEAWLFPGWLPLLFAVVAIVMTRHSPLRRHTWFYLVVVMTCLWMAIGPPLSLWQIVYWLPGLNFVRVPTRFLLLGVLALGVLAAIGVERVSSRVAPTRRAWVGVIVALLMIVEFRVPPFEVKPYAVTLPSADRWLNLQPKPFSVVELPLPDSGDVVVRERRNTLFMLHSMAHWQPTFHGFSGTQPPGYEDVYWQLTTFPDERSLRTLATRGVTYAVLHTDLVPPSELADTEARFEKFKAWVRLEYSQGTNRVYSLHWPAGR